ncbi:MAG TPA: Holliday junction resolvase RuvX [Vicinamibacteria bacterium]|jgi:putative Holliday junction resolvase
MRRLGLDVGDKVVGVAVSDETGTLARGLPNLARVGPRKDVKAVAALVREHQAGEVVVGLPRSLDGSLGPQAQKVLAFVEDLRGALRVPLVTWDERLTTVMAHRAFDEAELGRRRRKEVVDKVAAILILQSYLDYRKLADSEAR